MSGAGAVKLAAVAVAYLRTYAARDVAAWQAYTASRARHPATFTTQAAIEQRKTMIMREIRDLRVR